MEPDAVQDRYAPANACFGCGPANPDGLRIKSVVDGEELVCDWTPSPHHEAFPGVLNGGIIGACTVTADYAIRLRRPTPSAGPVHLRARIVELSAPRAVVEGELYADGKVCATCRGTFVAVGPGHPAYHRW